MVNVKGIAIFLFIFVGAIIMTYIATWLVMLDSSWHFRQRVHQAVTIWLMEYNIDISWYVGIGPVEDFTLLLFITMGINFPEVQHALYGISPITTILWFIGFLFLFMVIGGVFGLISSRVDLDPFKLFGFSAFVVVASIITTFAAVYLIIIDAQWNLRTLTLPSIMLVVFDAQLFYDFLSGICLVSWGLFEHLQGQSASSYVIWFVIFVIVYIVVSGVITWISRGRYITR